MIEHGEIPKGILREGGGEGFPIPRGGLCEHSRVCTSAEKERRLGGA